MYCERFCSAQEKGLDFEIYVAHVWHETCIPISSNVISVFHVFAFMYIMFHALTTDLYNRVSREDD